MLQAALVDVGGVLWSEQRSLPSPEDERPQRLCTAGVPPGATAALIEALEQAIEGADDLSYFDIKSAVKGACSTVGVDVSAEAIRHAMCVPAVDRVVALPGAGELLETIQALGLRSVILSNGIWRNAADYWDDFRALGHAPLIHDIVSSVDTCWRKPDSRIFEIALRAAAAPAKACVMIGNSEQKDIRPAIDLGMRTVRATIEEPRPLSSRAEVVCGSLAEVAQTLARLTREGDAA